MHETSYPGCQFIEKLWLLNPAFLKLSTFLLHHFRLLLLFLAGRESPLPQMAKKSFFGMRCPVKPFLNIKSPNEKLTTSKALLLRLAVPPYIALRRATIASSPLLPGKSYLTNLSLNKNYNYYRNNFAKSVC